MKASAKKAKARAQKQKAKRRSQVAPAISEEESALSFEAFLAEWESRRGRPAATAPTTAGPSSVSSATASHSPMTKMRRAFKAAVSRRPTKKQRVENRTSQVLHQGLESEIDESESGESEVWSSSATETSSTDRRATIGHPDAMDTSQIADDEPEESGSEEESPDEPDSPPPVSSIHKKAPRPSGIRDDPRHSPEFYMGPDPSEYSTHMSDTGREHEMAFRRSHADSVAELKRNRDVRDAQDAHDAQESSSSASSSEDQTSSGASASARAPESAEHDEFRDASADAASDSADSSPPSDSEVPSDGGDDVVREVLCRQAFLAVTDRTMLWNGIKHLSGQNARRLLFHEILDRMRHRHVLNSLWGSDRFVNDMETEILGRSTWTALHGGEENE